MDYFDKIYLIWRRGRGGTRFPVGILEKDSNGKFEFKYLPSKIAEAKKEGFEKYIGFPDVEKIYTENVLEILSQRLPRSQRYDLEEFYDFWLVDKSRIDDHFYMLAQTQGQLPTDSYELLADYKPQSGLKFISEIAGLSYVKVDRDFLSVGDQLDLEKDPENEGDKFAVKLKFKGLDVGYIKLIHSKSIYESEILPTVTVHHIEKNGSLKKVFIRVEFP